MKVQDFMMNFRKSKWNINPEKEKDKDKDREIEKIQFMNMKVPAQSIIIRKHPLEVLPQKKKRIMSSKFLSMKVKCIDLKKI